jgi:hypothetical protein
VDGDGVLQLAARPHAVVAHRVAAHAAPLDAAVPLHVDPGALPADVQAGRDLARPCDGGRHLRGVLETGLVPHVKLDVMQMEEHDVVGKSCCACVRLTVTFVILAVIYSLMSVCTGILVLEAARNSHLVCRTVVSY